MNKSVIDQLNEAFGTRTRTERWAQKRERMEKEAHDLDEYVTNLEEENDRLHRQLTDANIEIKELEYDKAILEIKLKWSGDAKN